MGAEWYTLYSRSDTRNLSTTQPHANTGHERYRSAVRQCGAMLRTMPTMLDTGTSASERNRCYRTWLNARAQCACIPNKSLVHSLQAAPNVLARVGVRGHHLIYILHILGESHLSADCQLLHRTVSAPADCLHNHTARSAVCMAQGSQPKEGLFLRDNHCHGRLPVACFVATARASAFRGHAEVDGVVHMPSTRGIHWMGRLKKRIRSNLTFAVSIRVEMNGEPSAYIKTHKVSHWGSQRLLVVRMKEPKVDVPGTSKCITSNCRGDNEKTRRGRCEYTHVLAVMMQIP